MYKLIVKNEDVAIVKVDTINDCLEADEIEITEEQYENITELPLKLTLENERVVAWEKTKLSIEEYIGPIHVPTIEDYLIDLDFRISLIELGV